MAVRISDVRVDFGLPESALFDRIKTIIGVPADGVERFSIVRRGIDARGKGAPRRVYTVECALRSSEDEEAVCARVPNARRYEPPPNPFPRFPARKPSLPPVVVGMGPAGMFAALTLARFGMPPVLLERGRPVEERERDVARFWKEGTLDPESNVQFGEGGAGTFSDGKLTTRIGDSLVEHVISTFADKAGISSLGLDAKPHVGTDRLAGFCRCMREELRSLGAVIRFGARVEELKVEGGAVRGVRLAGGEEIDAPVVVLAIGHSARDTIRGLHGQGILMTPKAFAVGLRVEHPQGLIDRIQYGGYAGKGLPGADYSLKAKTPGGRGIYSFCMCPGGEVVNAASGDGQAVVNGMSGRSRDSGFANSGIVAAVTPADFFGSEAPQGCPLAGIAFQEEIERRAFERGERGGLPSANLLSFVYGRKVSPFPARVRASKTTHDTLCGILPSHLEEELRFGFLRFGETMRGFLTKEATLYAVESRSSSPVRIERVNYESVSCKGLYPVGEGAGHAGGIVSSAVDGIRAALRVLELYSE
ncbi:MAG: FAD-dependent oxidoreductase [Syntrophorhabdaceae bacterium]|nr:FAD-dependent oxidoreductase [Syntrophorhabdaceae bacterium]